jgi:hypothetical protein
MNSKLTKGTTESARPPASDNPVAGTRRSFAQSLCSGRRNATFIGGWVAGTLLIGLGHILEIWPMTPENNRRFFYLIVAHTLITFVLYWLSVMRDVYYGEPLYALADAAREASRLQEQLDSDFFTTLVKINFKYIDAYYAQTQLQAGRSFILSVVASAMSLALILVGVATMLFTGEAGTAERAKVTTAAGVLSQFVAAVFFYLYNRTIIKMREYHRKLVLTQNVSIALKISEDLPDGDKAKARLTLIEALCKDINRHLIGQDERK